MNGKPTVVSLFAGTGGSSLGYQWAGFHELMAIDFDEHAEECFRLNFPDTLFVRNDITQIDGKDILEDIGLEKGELDCLDGSPPCQGFSMAGKRQVLDPRNDLLAHYVRLIREIEPRTFVMENVPGMVQGSMKGKWKAFWESLPHDQYQIKAKILNAKFYGVPQARRRVFVIGSKNFEPKFPVAKSKPIIVEEALCGIKPVDFCELSGKFGDMWHDVPPGKSASFVLCSEPVNNQGCKKLHPKRVCPTISKQNPGSGFRTMVHWAEKRSIAINEALILTSFPEMWKMTGTYQQKWARIGNSVPPKLMEAVAKTLKEQIENAQT